MLSMPCRWETNPECVHSLVPNKIPQFKNLSMAHFVTPRSLQLFESLHLPQDFLFKPISTWSECDDYNCSWNDVPVLNVVNDCAECAVRLAADFNEVLTKNDKQRQVFYQVVEHYQKLLLTNATKKQLLNQSNSQLNSNELDTA
jgi:hypothetical protein